MKTPPDDAANEPWPVVAPRQSTAATKDNVQVLPGRSRQSVTYKVPTTRAQSPQVPAAPDYNSAAKVVLMSADPVLHHQISLVAAGLGVDLEIHTGLVPMPSDAGLVVVLMDHVTVARYAAQLTNHYHNNTVPIILVTTSAPDAVQWQHAACAGVRQGYVIPAEREELANQVRHHIAPPRPQRVIAVNAVTAGSGATSFVSHLAHHCQRDFRCVIVDADPERRSLSHLLAKPHTKEVSWSTVVANQQNTSTRTDFAFLPRLNKIPALLFSNNQTPWDWRIACDTISTLALNFDLVLVDLTRNAWGSDAGRIALTTKQQWQLLGVCGIANLADISQGQYWSEHCPIPSTRRKAIIRRTSSAPLHDQELANILNVSGFKSVAWQHKKRNGQQLLARAAQQVARSVAEEMHENTPGVAGLRVSNPGASSRVHEWAPAPRLAI